MISKSEVGFRPLKQEDTNFVINSWLKSYYGTSARASSFCKFIIPPVYYKFHREVLGRFFNRNTAKVIIVHPKDEDDLIIGYIAYEQISNHDILHYVYVKEAFRDEGLARLLIEESQLDLSQCYVTHLTLKTEICLPKYKLTYVPYLL